MTALTQPRPAETTATAGASTIPAGSPLLLLGRRADPDAERGVLCPGDLPSASDPDLADRARRARAALGDRVIVLGHHYQRDDVIRFADATGDSFKLAQVAAAADAPNIVFCGVHFMAESASILARPDQTVILPDLAAGCSMADMAQHSQLVDAWARLERAGVATTTVPLTYMNSTAAIKAFCGEHGGAICTSSNAPRAMRWAFEQQGADGKVLFLPDQHLGRNTAVLSLGLELDDCVVYDPWKPDGGLTDDELRAATVVLWKGHCSVHARFTPQMVTAIRQELPGVEVMVHPECRYEVVRDADRVGSTGQIIRWVEEAPAGARIAIATELNLVKRLAAEHPDKEVVFLDDTVCFCATMNRIDLPHLVWVLESLVAGEVVNEVRVPDDVRHWSRVALERMLALPGDDASLLAAR
ncbi:MAG: quinolinate synthase NadA [Actinobacteria bacterium]|nr:quinolinate synthase NadA [Actinomycetota bacterium]